MSGKLGRDFWIYRCGLVATALGYSASTIAAMWWVLGEYQKMVYVSYLVVPPLVISALAQPLIAPAGDRYNKKLLIQIGLVVQLISYLCASSIFFVGKMNLSILIVFEMFSTVGKLIFSTGSIGILPHLVPENKITDGMNVTHRINSIMSIVGGVSGGTLVTFFGTTNAFVFLTVCLFISVILCSGMRCVSCESKGYNNMSSWIIDVREGFLYTVKNRVISGFFVYSLIIGLAFAPMLIAFPYIIKESKDLSAFFVGLLTTSMGIGVITGSLLYPFLAKKLNNKILVYVSSVLFFVALLCVSVFHNVAAVFLGQFIIGVSRNWINVTIDSLLLINLPKNLRTRVLSNMMFFSMINMPLAMLLSGYLMDLVGVYNILLALSGLCLIAMLVIISDRGIRRFLSADPEDALIMLRN